MMKIANARERRVSLVLRLTDIVMGETILGSHDIAVQSADRLLIPVAKPDGYFVFTDRSPDNVCVRSKQYHDAVICTEGHTGTVLRFALIPRISGARTVAVPAGAHIGFGNGYALGEPLTEASSDILLRKEDFIDATDLFHALVAPDAAATAVYLTKTLGNGRYALRAPPSHTVQVRGTRVVALHRTAGGQIPVPPGVKKMYILSEAIVTTVDLEGA